MPHCQVSGGETEKMAKAEALEVLAHSTDKILGREKRRGRRRGGDAREEKESGCDGVTTMRSITARGEC